MESDSKQKLPLTWKQISQMCDTIIHRMERANYVPLTILGIGAGGIIPAALIAYKLAKMTHTHPSVEAIYAWSYNEAESKPVRVPVQIEWPNPDRIACLNHPSTLLVDDIADSGHTLGAFLSRMPEIKSATLIHKQSSFIEPSFIGIYDDCSYDFWYIFPWETP